MYGLGYIGAAPSAAAIRLSINSPYQIVGQKPVYRIENATPGATITWYSLKDGQSTGELRASYEGGIVQENGSAVIEGEPWRDTDIGRWQKQVEINGQLAVVDFAVNGAANVVDGSALPSGGFLSNPLFYAGSYAVTPLTIGLVVGGVWLARSLKLIK